MSLTSKTVASTYKSLLRVREAQNLGASTGAELASMVDGDGSILPMSITIRPDNIINMPPSLSDGARIYLGTLPDDAQTGTVRITLSAEEIEFNSEQALELSSNDEIDMFGLGKFAMSGVMQLSGTRTNEQNTFQGESTPENVYQRHKAPGGDPALGVLPEQVSYGSMKEFGGFTELNEILRTIDFAGCLKPQYGGIYTVGDATRGMRGMYVNCTGIDNKPTSPEAVGDTIMLKLGDVDIDDGNTPTEDVCNLTINSSTSGLMYNRPSATDNAASSNQVIVKNLESVVRVSGVATYDLTDTLVTEIECSNSATGTNTTYNLNNTSNLGDMKIIVIKQSNSDNSTLTISDGSNTILTQSAAGAATLDFTFIKISSGWIQINA